MGNLSLLLAAGNVSNLTAVGIGLGTVFVGLIVIVLICKLTGILCNLNTVKTETAEQTETQPAVQTAPAVIENRGELAAAIAAAVAEDLGTDVSGIRILSIKKI